MEKQLYDAKDIQKLLGISRTSSYKVINELQEMFKKENPNCITILKKIPVKYFEKAVLGKE